MQRVAIDSDGSDEYRLVFECAGRLSNCKGNRANPQATAEANRSREETTLGTGQGTTRKQRYTHTQCLHANKNRRKIAQHTAKNYNMSFLLSRAILSLQNTYVSKATVRVAFMPVAASLFKLPH